MFSINTYTRQVSWKEWSILAAITVLGASLRFWGLANIGLHGDEETMGLAVKGILETGSPILPSGMYYARGLAQTLLMAGSAQIFGMTEWALRFPSAVTGTVMIVASFLLGKRFLPSNWALIFAFIVALLPALISVSQTGRMYVMYVTFVIIFAVFIFRWEHSESYLDYMLAFIIFLIALHLHRLSVFSIFLFFWPGLLKSSARLLVLGGIAFVAGMGAYEVLSNWTGSHYIRTIDFLSSDKFTANDYVDSFLPIDVPLYGWLLTGVFVSLAALFCIRALKSLNSRAGRVERLALLVFFSLAILGSIFVQYHVAIICLACGAVLYLRHDGRPVWLSAFVLMIVLVALLQIFVLAGGELFYQPKDVVMTMLGKPNPWPYLRFAAFFPMAVLAYSFVFAYFVVAYVRGRPIPDHVLLLIIAVWVPVFLIGLFAGHIPLRYVLSFVPFFVLAALAGLHAVYGRIAKQTLTNPMTFFAMVVAAILLFVSPTEFWHNVNPQYSDYSRLGGHRGADHKGAAEFVRSLDLKDSDIVMAEDVLQQTYYLGKVDYWLRKFTQYTYLDNDVYLDIYTGTPHAGNAEIFRDILNRSDRGDIIIIGSAETAGDLEYYVGSEILELLEKIETEVIYEGRDGVTKVLRVATSSAL